ncbi:MAG TPA: hypothetical protein VF097_05695 [Actinomycetota bacterium]
MIAFPLLATLVALVFGVHLALRFAQRRAPHEGLWSLAMLMFAGASGALALGVQDGWSAGEFRIYWLLGAVLTVPYLAAGELYLLARQRPWIAHLGVASLAIASVWAVIEIWGAPVDGAVLEETFPLGREVFGDGTLPHRLAQYFSFPAYFFLLGGATYSAGRMRGREELRDRFRGTALIAIGATIVAIGSGVGAGLGNFALFSISLAAGAAVTYWGFLVATRRPTAAPAAR